MIICENCIFFKSLMLNGDKGPGKCIRYAPRSGDIQLGGCWPFVYSDQSCGEFISVSDSSDYVSLYKYENDNEHP